MRLQMLDAGVEVFNVLAHDDHVDPFALVARWHSREFARRSNVGVRLKEFAQRDVGALLTEADRRLERPLQGNAGALDAVTRCLRHARGVALLEDLGTGLSLLPVEGHARRCGGGIEDALRGEGDLGADPVARDEGDGVASWGGHALRIAGLA